MVILVRVAECNDAKTTSIVIHGRQQQFFLLLRVFNNAEFFQRKTGVHVAWFADLILLAKEVSGGKWPDVEESLRFATASLTLPAPTDDALAGRAKALEKDVTILVWKIKFASLLRCVRAEVHVPPVVNV